MTERVTAQRQVAIVATLTSLSVASYVSRTLMSVAGPTLMSSYRISETDMGAIYSAFLIGYAGFMIPGGHLIDKIGSRRALTVVSIGMAVTSVLTAAAGLPQLTFALSAWSWLLAIRLLLGVMSAPMYPSAARANASWIDPKIARGYRDG